MFQLPGRCILRNRRNNKSGERVAIFLVRRNGLVSVDQVMRIVTYCLSHRLQDLTGLSQLPSWLTHFVLPAHLST